MKNPVGQKVKHKMIPEYGPGIVTDAYYENGENHIEVLFNNNEKSKFKYTERILNLLEFEEFEPDFDKSSDTDDFKEKGQEMIDDLRGERDIVIMTKSYKNKGYCVTGIDLKTKKWVRLTSKESNGAVPKDYMKYSIFERVSVLDVVSIQLKDNVNNSVQSENYYYDESIRPVYRCTYNLKKLIDWFPPEESKYIFGSREGINKPREMSRLNGKSLMFAELYDIKFSNNFNNKARFKYMDKNYSGFSVTDPYYYLGEGSNSPPLEDIPHAYAVLSIGEEYNGLHYKFLAKIFRDDEMEP